MAKIREDVVQIVAPIVIVVPSVPTYLRVADRDETIDVAAFSVEQLRTIGDAWTDKLVAHAAERKDRS